METTFGNLDELVFANRNKAYGAYAHRKNYPRYMNRALTAVLLVFLLVMALPVISNYHKDKRNNIGSNYVIVEPMINPVKEQDNLPVLPEEKPGGKIATVSRQPVIIIDTSALTDDMAGMQEKVENKGMDDTTAGGGTNPETEKPALKIIDEPTPVTYLIVEEMPEFPGGYEGLKNYLGKNLVYPQIAIDIGIQGRVFVGFVINEKGKPVEVNILRGIGGGCDEEALRVVQNMPDWRPGYQNGIAVRVQYSLGILFTLK